jgi:hypothetical protein
MQAIGRSHLAAIPLALLLLGPALACQRDKAEPSGRNGQPQLTATTTKTAQPAAGADKKPQPVENPLLWRIGPAADGQQQPAGYLYGTIHVPDDRVLALPPAVIGALRTSTAVFTEIPMDSATQMAMAPKLMLSEGRTLDDVLPADLYARVEKKVSASGLPMTMIKRFKIWALATQLILLDRMVEFATKQPLDKVIRERGRTAGKRLGALETVDEQLAVFDELSEKEQVHLLRQTLDMLDEHAAKGEDPIEIMVEAYLTGDAAELERVMMETYDPDNPIDRKLIGRLFTERNQRMAERIRKELTAAEGPVFFAVGAGHLVGDDGLVDLLRQAELTVERVGADE